MHAPCSSAPPSARSPASSPSTASPRPGIILGANGLVSFSGGATLPVGAAVLALAALPALRGPAGIRPGLWLAGALHAAVGGRGRRRRRRARSVGDLRGSELVAAEEDSLGSHIRALTVRLAEKDDYTEEHTRRVALRAVQVGEELGLPPGRLRSLAAGGLLHDIGKLSVPEEVLKKPGPLDEGEYAVVQRHPELGRRLLREFGGFGEGVLRLVHDHHERLDGSGYPQGRLAAEELDLDTRILAVCNVYDALISTRVYRAAWSPSRHSPSSASRPARSSTPAASRRSRACWHARRRLLSAPRSRRR